MAKYTITHSCDHEQVVSIFGPEKDRPRKREWLASQPCPDCKRKSADQDATTWAGGKGLVELQGSEKQIAWAQKIRKQLISDIDLLVEESSKDENTTDEFMASIVSAYEFITKQSSAKYWIDNRNRMARNLLLEVQGKINDAQRSDRKPSFTASPDQRWG